MERALLGLYASVRGETVPACEKDFYHFRSLDLRFAMVRAALISADLADDVRAVALRAIKRGRKAAVRRNRLVHGEWSFAGGAMRVSTTRAVVGGDHQVDAKLINEVTMAYNDAATLLAAAAGAVSPPRHDNYSIRVVVASQLDAEMAAMEVEMRRRAGLTNESLGFARIGASDRTDEEGGG